jgi:hypothetical protein
MTTFVIDAPVAVEQSQRNDALDAPFTNSITLATDLGYSQPAASENPS